MDGDNHTGRDAATASHFGLRLRTWRRTNNIKQAALAHMLGVSQPAIARWERGHDIPATQHLRKIQSLMAKSVSDEVALEAMYIRRQSGIRALFDTDGMRMIAISEGFRARWPDFSLLKGVALAANLVNEAQQVIEGSESGLHLRQGALGLVSGVSHRHTDIELDTAVPHRWHMCIRRYGGMRLADMVYEPCPPDLTTGITDMVYLDTIGDQL